MANVLTAEPIVAQYRMSMSDGICRHVLDSLDSAVCAVDRDLRVTLANRAWDYLATDLGRPELRAERLIGRLLLDALEPQVAREWADICMRLLDGEAAHYWTTFHVPLVQGQRWTTLTAHALYDQGEVIGLSLELTDITERRMIEEQAIKRQVELRGLFEVTQSISMVSDSTELYRRVTGHLGYLFGARICAIVLHDPQTGCLSTMSPAYGLSDAETREFALPRTLRADVDASMHDGVGASYIVRDTLVAECDDCREFGQRWSASTVLVAPLRNYRRFIGYLALAGKASAFNEEAGYLLATFAGLIAAAIDANLLVLALRDRADKLSSALAEIEEVDRLKDELIQNVSHELRLPLMVIQGYADLVKTGAFGPLHPDLQRAIEVISDKAAVLGRRVGDFVVLRGLHRTDLQLSRVSLAVLAREAIERAKPGAAQNGIVFKDDIIPETLPLFADRRRMEQVIDELLGNAVKFSPDGGRVFVTVREGGDVVYLKVADQGIGIPPSQINRIWDQFYQFDGSTTRRFGGTGIGLAVVKQIVEAHGGQVWVESQEGQGSQFYVALRMGHPEIGKAGSEP